MRKSEAADGSGLLVTTAQLGLLLGVARFGALFLGRGGSDALSPSVSAASATERCVTLASMALMGALTGALAGALSRAVRRARRQDR